MVLLYFSCLREISEPTLENFSTAEDIGLCSVDSWLCLSVFRKCARTWKLNYTLGGVVTGTWLPVEISAWSYIYSTNNVILLYYTVHINAIHCIGWPIRLLLQSLLRDLDLDRQTGVIENWLVNTSLSNDVAVAGSSAWLPLVVALKEGVCLKLRTCLTFCTLLL